MPGQYHLSVDELVKECKDAAGMGIPAVLLFGIPEDKDPRGSEAYAEDGIVQQAMRAVKDTVPDLLVITDVCLCEYTSHGHCGVVEDGTVKQRSDARAARAHGRLARGGRRRRGRAVRHDGRPGGRHPRGARRGARSSRRRSWPTRPSTPRASTGRSARPPSPRRSSATAARYQMDPANAQEAMREIALDLDEGADIVMVKPALPYLDIISRAQAEFGVPLAAYSVSGEYAMIRAAGQLGWLDEERAMMEALTSHQARRRRHRHHLLRQGRRARCSSAGSTCAEAGAMRISAKGEYAIKAMLDLAHAPRARPHADPGDRRAPGDSAALPRAGAALAQARRAC